MSTFTLKILALVFMLIDHIGIFIPNMPEYLHWIGRLAAPIFIFCSAWGYTYTKNRLAYLTRLYIANVVMAIIQCFLYIDYNFFRTIFSMCIIFSFIDLYISKDKKFKKYLFFYLAWQIATITTIIILVNSMRFPQEWLGYFLPSFFGNIFYMEGGLVFVCLGVLIYLTKNNKIALSIAYIVFTVMYSFANMTSLIPIVLGKLVFWNSMWLSDILDYILIVFIGFHPMDTGSFYYSWMIIFALPLILLYNGKRGAKIKYLFYIFYPAHIILLFYIGNLIE